ncbi:TetR/AcrR family transcriptional regulator [Bacillus spizizenii]|nr:TetR/AcrR family transcriptional regulator [Bacillus spizizenii]MCY7867997.1 TetR/AcrR family transcriptional regulator [Bacillus spizizenii]MCY8051834.1 TetR/AcrR family transcriptional regulator [Bacillus spizizenii]MCY8125902.1 TetR/AcrR family transcriptional regulator [Bacillus spizizenii]MCY8165139.1 TetR/AcrR family transcriptional regulator [Bacillus spizizenii]
MIKLKQSERSAQRKEKLIDTALELFSSRGYNGTTVKEIAKEAGVTDGLIYHYFSSKEELLHAILAKHNFLEDVQRILDFHDELPVDETLHRLGDRLFELMVNKSSFVIMVFGESQRNQIMAEKLKGLIDKGVATLGNFLDKRADYGEIKSLDYPSLARHFIGSLFIYFMTYGKSCTEKDRKIYLKTVIQALCEGIIKK